MADDHPRREHPMPRPDIDAAAGRRLGEPFRHARLGVLERLADPYLTDHDRWVLGQFARFLSGRAPEPDPRVLVRRPTGPLRPQVRQTTLVLTPDGLTRRPRA
jgi:hypothetical protein